MTTCTAKTEAVEIAIDKKTQQRRCENVYNRLQKSSPSKSDSLVAATEASDGQCLKCPMRKMVKYTSILPRALVQLTYGLITRSLLYRIGGIPVEADCNAESPTRIALSLSCGDGRLRSRGMCVTTILSSFFKRI